MGRTLPPLNWVRAFDAAARHEGFQRAGTELGVSPGAVSQMVKSLEAHLGLALFERLARGVRLTEAGRQYGAAVGPALDRIAQATDRIAVRPSADVIRIAALPALAALWLTPRLSGFQENHPGLSVEVSIAPDIRQLSETAFDLAIHYAGQAIDGFHEIPLFQDTMFPVCSPGYARTHDIKATADLARCRLLYDMQWADDWSRWFSDAGMAADTGNRESGFALYSMAVEAAVAGLGVLMGHGALVSGDLESGRLCAPVGSRIDVPHRYVAVVPDDRTRRRAIVPFLDWLGAEFQLSMGEK